jgi:hypothetical protein
MLGKRLLELQKMRINGPFERVTFIDPYPDKILKTPSFLISKIFMLLALLNFASLFIVGGFGGSLELVNKQDNAIIVAIGNFIYLQIDNVAGYFKVDRIEILVYILATIFLLMIFFMIMYNRLSTWLIAVNWKKKCETASAQILDSEIQKMQIIKRTNSKSGASNKLETCYVLRIKVKFTHKNKTYEATPSVVNRLSPGSIGIHFTHRKDCENLLSTYQEALEIEFDPQTPLDCEIKENLNEILNKGKKAWLPKVIFVGGVLLFTQLIIFIIRNENV